MACCNNKKMYLCAQDHMTFRILNMADHEVMNSFLSALPEKVASVFALREIDGISSEEICATLNLSANNFWVIMHRARMQLRRCIEIKWFKHPI